MCEQDQPREQRQNTRLDTHLLSERESMPNTKLEHCIAECGNCQETCLATVAHCLTMGGRLAEAHHIRVMLDCAEICQVAANFMLRRSSLHSYVCRACAEICDKCAQSCEAVSGDDEQMKQCIESCHRCADACREMAGLNYKAA